MEKKEQKVIKKGFQSESIQDCDDPYEVVRKAVKAQENPEEEEDVEKCLRSKDKLFTH